MKTDLQGFLRGKALKNQIFKTISLAKFQSITNLLKNSRGIVKDRPFSSSQNTMIRSQDSPEVKNDLSIQRINQSPPPPSINHSNSKAPRSIQKNKIGSQRSKKAGSEMKFNSKNKKKELAFIKRTNIQKALEGKYDQKASKQKESHFRSHEKKSSNQNHQYKSQNKAMKIKSKSKSKSKSRSKHHCSSKLNLSSIKQQSSSQEKINTPRQKNYAKKQGEKKKVSSIDSTRKKQKNELIHQTLLKKIQKSFREPSNFQTLLKSDLISVKYRILRRRLIEIQICIFHSVYDLRLSLDKGNVECQNINQHYQHLTSNTILQLFTSIRDINVEQPFHFPKLILQIFKGEEKIKIKHVLALPYCWLHFAEEGSKQFQKSRIKTKICLEDAVLSSKNIKTLSLALPNFPMRSVKSQNEYETRFILSGQQFELKIRQHSGLGIVELQGRGEQRLTKMIEFLSELLC